MANLKRGLQGVRTMGGLVDQRRARTPAGALLELSSMANEKQRLEQEVNRWRRRHLEIKARLAEIAEKERRLYEFVKKPRREAPRPANGDAGPRFRTTEIGY